MLPLISCIINVVQMNKTNHYLYSKRPLISGKSCLTVFIKPIANMLLQNSHPLFVKTSVFTLSFFCYSSNLFDTFCTRVFHYLFSHKTYFIKQRTTISFILGKSSSCIQIFSPFLQLLVVYYCTLNKLEKINFKHIYSTY